MFDSSVRNVYKIFNWKFINKNSLLKFDKHEITGISVRAAKLKSNKTEYLNEHLQRQHNVRLTEKVLEINRKNVPSKLGLSSTYVSFCALPLISYLQPILSEIKDDIIALLNLRNMSREDIKGLINKLSGLQQKVCDMISALSKPSWMSNGQAGNFAASFKATIQALATEKLNEVNKFCDTHLENNIHREVQKRIDRLNLISEEARVSGLKMERIFARGRNEMEKLPAVYARRTKQLVQEMSTSSLNQAREAVKNDLSQCEHSISALVQELRVAFAESPSYMKLAALLLRASSTLVRVQTNVYRIPQNAISFISAFPSRANVIILANTEEATSQADQILEEIIKQVRNK